MPKVKLIKVYNTEGYDNYGDRLDEYVINSLSDWTEISDNELTLLQSFKFNQFINKKLNGKNSIYYKVVVLEELPKEEILEIIPDLKKFIKETKKKEEEEKEKAAEAAKKKRELAESKKLEKARKLIEKNKKILKEAGLEP